MNRGLLVFAAEQRGVALPMALLTLAILSGLVLAFSSLSATEPTIASNQVMVAQARSLAEGGVELALWALMNPGDAKGIPVAGPIPAPYDGSRPITVAAGGTEVGSVRVVVTGGEAGCASVAERCIVATGWVPNEATRGPKAHQKIAVTAGNPQRLFKNPPASVVAHGDLQVTGDSLVESRSDASCGRKAGVIVSGRTSLSGATIYGDGNDIPNETTSASSGSISEGADIVTDVATSALVPYLWNDDDVNFLRAYARARGTYLRGSANFGAGTRIPDGLVFVDTPSGRNASQASGAGADIPRVEISGAAGTDPNGMFRGWLFVNGVLSIGGDFRMNGLAYAQNEFSYRGSGASTISGAVVSRNVGGAASTRIEADALGRATIAFNCAFSKTGDGSIPDSWMIMPGTYRELCDSCAS